MAIDFSKYNFFKRLDARARVFVLAAGLAIAVFLIYLGVRYFSGGNQSLGPTRLASAPPLQSVPGGTLNPEYQQAVLQANTQSAQQAQMSGGSAVPTLVNFGQQVSQGSNCIICSDQSANVKNLLDDWVRLGKVSPDVSAAIQGWASANLPIGDFAGQLQDLIKAGKLDPEQGRLLLNEYRKQHANALLLDSANLMDPLIKSGQLPLDIATELLKAQRDGMSPSDYANLLRKYVADGLLTPAVAQQLLTQYTQQKANEIIRQSVSLLQQMQRSGQLTADVEKTLEDLEYKMVPQDSFIASVQQLVSQGKIVPAVATKIIDEYKDQKKALGPAGALNMLIESALAAALQEIKDLLSTNQISSDVAAFLTQLVQSNLTLAQFQAYINQLVQQNKLTPAIAKLKIEDYQKILASRGVADRLGNLQANNVSPDTYANELKADVQAGYLTPQDAADLMQQYLASLAQPITTPIPVAPGNEAFASLQQKVAQGTTPGVQPLPTVQEFTVPQTPTESTQNEQQAVNQRIATLMSQMSGQAQQLIASWSPPVPLMKSVTTETEVKTTKATSATSSSGGPGVVARSSGPLIKAGTILFAVLDTSVNSDYPDSPVMATIVLGPYKGAKLLGKLQTTKNNVGQMDRIILNFTMMNDDAWLDAKTITAYAIDPDTGRSALASKVNYHYLVRFGSIFATSFLQGFSNALTTSNSTSTTGIFGTSTTHPVLQTSEQIWVALGQVGQNLGTVVQNYANIPPTVVVNSGVGIGILFMQDVS